MTVIDEINLADIRKIVAAGQTLRNDEAKTLLRIIDELWSKIRDEDDRYIL